MVSDFTFSARLSAFSLAFANASSSFLEASEAEPVASTLLSQEDVSFFTSLSAALSSFFKTPSALSCSSVLVFEVENDSASFLKNPLVLEAFCPIEFVKFPSFSSGETAEVELFFTFFIPASYSLVSRLILAKRLNTSIFRSPPAICFSCVR